MSNRLVFIGLLVLVSIQSHAQMSNERCKWITDFNRPISLDSLSVVAGSIVADKSIDISHNISLGEVTLISIDQIDSALVCYKVYPLAFHQSYFNRDLSVYDSNAYFKDPVKESSFLKQDELFHTEGLYKSGSLSRGISFGNNQDVFVNSALNLNLDGQLAENLFIRASITDQNVPYQPEGNTQQLQDFDNVSIELYNDRFSLTGGDVVFKNNPSNFLRYYKNVQGGLARLNYDVGNSTADSYAGFSVAKGRFASIQIQAVEGLSGPYRIPGPNAERFLLILANSERVFLDGKLLQRGFDNDYIIDYNSAELTFTNSVLITQFSRIRVDYEYSDQNYSRAITTGGHSQTIGQLKFSVDAYSEKDNENRPLLFDLTDDDKLFLSSIGDDLDLAQISTADSVGFTNETVLYKKVIFSDPTIGDIELFEYSTNPDSAFYRVSFTDVGIGNGDYVQANSTANGRVFEWVAPINGVSQGRYAPTSLLPAPNKKQMITFAAEYQLNKYERVYSELALSEQDLNLYSDIDDEDNAAFAIKSGIISENRTLSFLPQYSLNSYVDFEFDQENFTPIDRFRYIEFDRDWNYDPSTDDRRFEDNITNAGIELRKDANNLFKYDVTHRDRGPQVNGFQHNFRGNVRWNNIQLKSSYFQMNNDQQIQRAEWQRYKADVSYRAGSVVPGYIYHVDHNTITTAQTDSIRFSAMYFDEHTFYLQSGDSSSFTYDLRHSIREDKTPQNGEINDFTTSNTTRLTMAKEFENNSIQAVFNYRELDNQLLDETEETIAGRLDWSGRWLDNHIRSEMTYAIANSQELKREFVFINVPAGQGTHTWRDLNEDGVQDLGEFFEAINPDERNYAKIFTPSNEFVQAFQNLFTFRINVDAPRSWQSANGIKKILSKFSNNTSWSADTKTTDKDLDVRLLAFAKDIEEASLLTERNALRSTLFFNRTNPIYGLDFTYANNENKQLLNNGFEFRRIEEYLSNIRLNLSKQYSLTLRSGRSTKEVNSDFLEDRNYLLSIYRFNPQVAWQPSDNVRFSVQYGLTDKKNTLASENAEEATLSEVIGEVRLNKAIKSNFSARVRWVDIGFNGEESSPVGYDMLEALRPGTNITWTVNWQQKITKGLQLNLTYNGRKSEDNNPVHIGRVQVSALF